MKTDETAAIILAAGEGTRIKAKGSNKVTFKIAGKPMICYGVDTLKKSGIKRIVVVVKFKEESVKKVLENSVIYVRQGEKKGTAAALEAGVGALNDDLGNVIVMYGDDSAFYTQDLIRFLLNKHLESRADVSLLSIKVNDPTGLGRIVRDDNGRIAEIIEEKMATDEQRRIQEINTGCYCFKLDFLRKRIPEIEMNLISKEYYLTDIIEIALRHEEKVNVCLYSDNSVWFGVNNRSQWVKAGRLKRSLGAGI